MFKLSISSSSNNTMWSHPVSPFLTCATHDESQVAVAVIVAVVVGYISENLRASRGGWASRVWASHGYLMTSRGHLVGIS